MVWMFAQSAAEVMPEVLLGIKCAVEKEVSKVVVEVDFALMRKEKNLSYYGGIILDVLDAWKSFESISLNWVRRIENYVAHCLARFFFFFNSLYLSSSIQEAIVNTLEVNSLVLD